MRVQLTLRGSLHNLRGGSETDSGGDEEDEQQQHHGGGEESEIVMEKPRRPRRARAAKARAPRLKNKSKAEDDVEEQSSKNEDLDEEEEEFKKPVKRRGRPPGTGKGRGKGRKATQEEEDMVEDGLDDEESIAAALAEFKEQQRFIRESHDDVMSSPRAAKYSDASLNMPRPGTAEHDEFLQYTEELAVNQSVHQEIIDEGPNPYYNWAETHGGEQPEWDGRHRFEGDDGEVYIADGSGLEHVDEEGFDEDGNFYPFKDLGEERWAKLLEEHMERDEKACAELDAAEDEEVMRTGTLKRLQHKEEWLDEDGFLKPECLEPNSTFLQANDLVDPAWVLPSPSKIRWRGPDIDADSLGGAVKEWDIACNNEVVQRQNETTMLRHTGVGCIIELWHASPGWLGFRSGVEEQNYNLFPDGSMGRITNLIDEDLIDFMEEEADDHFEFKMKTTHWIAGNWRGMLCGPRVVVWNVVIPQTEIHLTDDGFVFIGCFGRAIQVKAEALHPDRHRMRFTNALAAFDMIRDHYNKTRPCMWERVQTEDLTGSCVYLKVMRHEKAPDPRLRWLTDEEWAEKKELIRKGKMPVLPGAYDRDELLQELRDSRLRAVQLRNDSTEAFVVTSDHIKDLDPGFNDEFDIDGTPGKGFYDENDVWRDDWVFTEIPRYRQKLPHTDNELEEKRHFVRLDELKRLKKMYKLLKRASCPPDKWPWKYRNLQYSQFDMQGLPTHYHNGTLLPQELRQEFEEDYRAHEDEHAAFQKELEAHPDLLERLTNRIDYLQGRVSFYDPYQMTTDEETADARVLYSDTRAEDLFHDEEHDYSDSSSSDELHWNPRM